MASPGEAAPVPALVPVPKLAALAPAQAPPVPPPLTTIIPPPPPRMTTGGAVLFRNEQGRHIAGHANPHHLHQVPPAHHHHPYAPPAPAPPVVPQATAPLPPPLQYNTNPHQQQAGVATGYGGYQQQHPTTTTFYAPPPPPPMIVTGTTAGAAISARPPTSTLVHKASPPSALYFQQQSQSQSQSEPQPQKPGDDGTAANSPATSPEKEEKQQNQEVTKGEKPKTSGGLALLGSAAQLFLDHSTTRYVAAADEGGDDHTAKEKAATEKTKSSQEKETTKSSPSPSKSDEKKVEKEGAHDHQQQKQSPSPRPKQPAETTGGMVLCSSSDEDDDKDGHGQRVTRSRSRKKKKNHFHSESSPPTSSAEEDSATSAVAVAVPAAVAVPPAPTSHMQGPHRIWAPANAPGAPLHAPASAAAVAAPYDHNYNQRAPVSMTVHAPPFSSHSDINVAKYYMNGSTIQNGGTSSFQRGTMVVPSLPSPPPAPIPLPNSVVNQQLVNSNNENSFVSTNPDLNLPSSIVGTAAPIDMGSVFSKSEKDRIYLTENPKPMDVLSFKGNQTAPCRSDGNKLFRALVQEHRDFFSRTSSRKQKTQACKKIVEIVVQSGGRFVKKIYNCEERHGRYYLLTMPEALKKTSKALNDSSKQALYRKALKEHDKEKIVLTAAAPGSAAGVVARSHLPEPPIIVATNGGSMVHPAPQREIHSVSAAKPGAPITWHNGTAHHHMSNGAFPQQPPPPPQGHTWRHHGAHSNPANPPNYSSTQPFYQAPPPPPRRIPPPPPSLLRPDSATMDLSGIHQHIV